MNLIEGFWKQLRLEGHKDDFLQDYRLALLDVMAHLCEMYRRSLPPDAPWVCVPALRFPWKPDNTPRRAVEPGPSRSREVVNHESKEDLHSQALCRRQHAQFHAGPAHLRNILETDFKGVYALKVIDVLKNPQLAEEDKILATPTLSKILPPPVRRIIGDLSDREKVLIGLDLLYEELSEEGLSDLGFSLLDRDGFPGGAAESAQEEGEAPAASGEGLGPEAS